MATFSYRYRQEMAPIGNRKYATVYIKQSHAEHARLRTWLVHVAEQIIHTCEHNASLAEWFSQPHTAFRKSQRGQYYTPEELLTDMISQLAQGRDLPQAMLDRWNCLVQGTPWEIELSTDQRISAQAQAKAWSN